MVFRPALGLLLAAVTAGTSAVCSTVLDILPIALWLTGIAAGHAALNHIKQKGSPGRGRAVWGLVLGYVGLLFTILMIVLIFVLVMAGVGTGVLDKILPSFFGH